VLRGGNGRERSGKGYDFENAWCSQGYTKHPKLQATFLWKEIGEEAESPKTLTFWTKAW
jgi:hypothetical protein